MHVGGSQTRMLSLVQENVPLACPQADLVGGGIFLGSLFHSDPSWREVDIKLPRTAT